MQSGSNNTFLSVIVKIKCCQTRYNTLVTFIECLLQALSKSRIVTLTQSNNLIHRPYSNTVSLQDQHTSDTQVPFQLLGLAVNQIGVAPVLSALHVFHFQYYSFVCVYKFKF